MCVGGAGAASRSPPPAAASRTQKRRARREAALDRVERAGELDEPVSRGGRWRVQQRERLEQERHTLVCTPVACTPVYVVCREYLQERQASVGASGEDEAASEQRAMGATGAPEPEPVYRCCIGVV